jgi:hypothetical protein
MQRLPLMHDISRNVANCASWNKIPAALLARTGKLVPFPAANLLMQHIPRLRECDLDRIFPMNDPASAWLMRVKARCLCEAGVVSPTLRAEIDRRALRVTRAAGPRSDRQVVLELST